MIAPRRQHKLASYAAKQKSCRGRARSASNRILRTNLRKARAFAARRMHEGSATAETAALFLKPWMCRMSAWRSARRSALK
jgi:hypothetical protein